ncbi:hypothetical protein ACUSIJ_01880 [Pseudochelatococcus sp. B33]
MSGTDRAHTAPSPETPAGWWTLALIAAVVLVTMQPYYYGYRLSGDDVWFLTLAIEGSETVRANALHVAQDQGRIGQVLMVPLNVLGAYLAGDPLWRVVLLAAYVLQLLLFAVFVARLLRREVGPFLLMQLVALHPLAFAFLPPNAYPLQNTVPFIVILLSRLAIVDLRSRGGPAGWRAAAAQALFALGMLVSEFAVAFGTALLVAEYLARLQWARENGARENGARENGGRENGGREDGAREDGEALRAAIRAAFAPRFVAADALAVLAVLVPYSLFRWAHPGVYEGNSAGGLSDIGRIAITVFGHVRDGTAFPRLGGGLSSASPAVLLAALVTGVLVALVLYRTASPVRRIGAPVATAVTALVLAAYVTLPIAVSTKYQEACADRGACAYIDSRMSYLAVTVALMGALAALWRHAGARRVLVGACAALGVMAALVSVYNAGKARDMRQVHAVWQRADALACSAPGLANDEAALLATIDPQGLVVVNPPNRAVDFWKIYIPWRANRACVAE